MAKLSPYQLDLFDGAEGVLSGQGAADPEAVEQAARDALEQAAVGVKPQQIYPLTWPYPPGFRLEPPGVRVPTPEHASRDEVQILRTRLAQQEARIRALEAAIRGKS